jgi:hypothetical protein
LNSRLTFHNLRRGMLPHILPDCPAYSFGFDLPQIAQAMAAIQPTMVNENKLRRAISVILACLRFTAIQIGIALMAYNAKSSNVLTGGRPMPENSPRIPPTNRFRESWSPNRQLPFRQQTASLQGSPQFLSSAVPSQIPRISLIQFEKKNLPNSSGYFFEIATLYS